MAQERRRAKKARRRRAAAHSPHEVLVKALNHPLRVKALATLSQRTASPTEISEQLDVELSNVAYHVRVLDELGLIEIVDEERVRGSVAHFYRAVERPLIENRDWQELDPEVRNAFSGYVIDALISDVAKSLAAGVFDRRDDRHLSRTPLLLDEEGWRKVSEIQAEGDKRILEAQAEAAERINGAGSKTIHAITGMLCFEVLPSAEG